ncbi:prolyl oligopeptidase family serine peptidase [Roseiconus lacunae]|uniref:Prolyl oligopeptidase family serine peptidase n=1 Tax=Roseiconus lacunae TaxID=2605694 RepID=A0ABT7PFK7_9BACT|nr:prolyl oligopeptidase family serine peptidase [Roseiconus lacunae]MDM4015158.1 prolyl oligopeptidase family serine peptidase [Roseiconus lacunae]
MFPAAIDGQRRFGFFDGGTEEQGSPRGRSSGVQQRSELAVWISTISVVPKTENVPLSISFPRSRSIALFWTVIAVAVSVCMPVAAQPSSASRGQARQGSRTINQRIVARWIDSTHFTFLEELPDGERVTRQVDCESGEITTLNGPTNGRGGTLAGGPLPVSEISPTDTELTFVNEADEPVELFWIDLRGTPVSYGSVDPGTRRSQHTFSGHAWMVRSAAGKESERKFYGSLVASNRPIVAKISKTFEAPARLTRRPGRNRPRGGFRGALSPDQTMRFAIENEGEGDDSIATLKVWNEGQGRGAAKELLSVEDAGLADWSWSPDGQYLAGWKVSRHQPDLVTMVESSPKGGGRAKVHQHSYRLPGDPYDDYQLMVVKVGEGELVACDVPVVDFGRPRIRWMNEQTIVFEKVDRGHQRFRLFVVDANGGRSRTAIDESTETFIWTMHGPDVPLVTHLEGSDEVLYSSEASGYRHLYLIDLADESQAFIHSPGNSTKQTSTNTSLAVTQGDWLVRRIHQINEQSRTVDLIVGGFYADQDPYHRHLIRASLDDDNLVALTDADGDHSFEFSPESDYVITTSSRVDSPPLHQLRKVSDGGLVCDLVQAQRIDDSADYHAPIRFKAKGRDGSTDIWGNLYLPADFDPSQQQHYPIIEAIYAGPHDSHVPIRYLHEPRHSDLTSLGFAVVQIDGMGTANRSKAFHDVCWHNLKDAGFPDRVRWIQAIAKEHPALDDSRVGIFGTSAGGQNACGALLFHGDFYKSAYASCGCHDNRMDKASWNEQWMGYPVGPHYAASSNIDNAGRLEGNLFLVVGELDTNVPPESTYRLVDALIKANKDFDFLMVPSMGHSDGGRYGKRRMRDFFVRTLQPPGE